MQAIPRPAQGGRRAAAPQAGGRQTQRVDVTTLGTFKRLLGGAVCLTLHDMKTTALTIRLDRELERRLARLARRTGQSRSDLVREALRRQLALAEFRELRRRIMPFAEARGYLTDEDVFRDVS